MSSPSSASAEPLLTAADVARILRVPRNAVYIMARAKRLPCIRIGNRVRFAAVDLARLIEEAKR